MGTGGFRKSVIWRVIGFNSNIFSVSEEKGVCLLAEVRVEGLIEFRLGLIELNRGELIVAKSLSGTVWADYSCLVVAASCFR